MYAGPLNEAEARLDAGVAWGYGRRRTSWPTITHRTDRSPRGRSRRSASGTDAESDRGWVPQFEHLLIDQTEQNPESVAGTLGARLAQLALMAEYRREDWESWEELLNQVVQLVDKLYPDAGIDRVALHVEYVLLGLKTNE